MAKFELTQREIDLIKFLQESDTVGNALVELLEHFCDHICNVRNMDDYDAPTMKAHKVVADRLEAEIIHRIRMGNGKPKNPVNQAI